MPDERLTPEERATLERLARVFLAASDPGDWTETKRADYGKKAIFFRSATNPATVLRLLADLRAAEEREKQAREREIGAHQNAEGWLDDANRNEAALLDERQRAERAEAALRELAAAVRAEREAEGPYNAAVNDGRRAEEIHPLYLAWDAARKRVDAALASAGEEDGRG